MTNEQRIARIAIDNNIITELKAVELLDNGEGYKIPLHTLSAWKKIGKEKGLDYRIRENESGIPCRLWKKRTNKDSKTEFFLAKCFLFTEKQIEIYNE